MPTITESIPRPRDDIPVSERLRLTEIFHSLQGEADTVGVPTVFSRLTGGPLRCVYCDTAYAFHGGTWHSMDETMSQVRAFGIPTVCVHGTFECAAFGFNTRKLNRTEHHQTP